MRFRCEEYAMRVLDNQYGFVNHDGQGLLVDSKYNPGQASYYRGLKTAFEIVLSDGYTEPVGIHVDENGHHTIVEFDGEGH